MDAVMFSKADIWTKANVYPRLCLNLHWVELWLSIL